MPGAVILAARAALRTGAGLVTVITIRQHLEAISSAVPEAMVKTSSIEADDGLSIETLFKEPFIEHVTHVAIGMGFGQDEWSLQMLRHCLQLQKPMLIDADALNLIAKHGLTASNFSRISPLVITPHPGEAGRLLAKNEIYTTADVQKDRFVAVKKLHAMFQGHESCTVILKGSGTLIYDGRTTKVCCLGSAAMAAPGMGDVLSGIIIALLAQYKVFADVTSSDIAELGVCLHAAAATRVSGDKTRGLLASDVIDALATVVQ
jgi:NAD(P)H-hydrate epimerase